MKSRPCAVPTLAPSLKTGIVLFVCCLLPALSSAQVTVDWVQPTAGVSIAVDSADNVYTVYYAYALGDEITLTKRDADGNFLWEASYDQTDPTKWEKATWVATDHEDNVIVSGTLMSAYSNPVNAASIVMKFSPAGDLLWRRVYESSFDGSYTTKCLVDDDDNIYVLGVGSGPPGYVTKVKKFAPDGTALWSYFDADGIGAPTNFKLTPEGCIVIAGRGIYGSVNGYAKIDLQGNKIWSFPGVYSLTVGDADGDGSGNTYLVHGEYVSNGGTVIKKLSPSGALIWQKVYALSAFRVEVGNDNLPVASGYPNAGTAGAAFVKADGAGNLLWSNLDADGPLSLLLHAHMLMDESNNAYLAAGTLFEMAVCKVNSDGTSAWTQTTPGSYANAIALGNADDSVFVVGGNTARLRGSPGPDSPPVASALATPSSGEVPLGVAFSSAGSYDPEGGALSYAWDFGDGTVSSKSSPSHTYGAVGTYAVTLTVTDPEGLKDTTTLTVTVTRKALRSTDIGLTAVRAFGTVTVTGNVTVKDSANAAVPGAAVSIRWKLPNGTTRTGTAVTDASGVAGFTVKGGRGTYGLTVTKITKSGYFFDAANSVLTKSITK